MCFDRQERRHMLRISRPEAHCFDAALTFSQCVVDPVAAQNLVHVPSVEEAVSSDHHLERLCAAEE